MGGTLAVLSDKGQRILIVDLTTGEPTEFAEQGVRIHQSAEASRMLGVDLVNLGVHDRALEDTHAPRLEIAWLIREHRPLAAYQSIFQPEGDRLLSLYEEEDQHDGRMTDVAYAEIFRSA
jgi:LmbE family N-acetylglucosaminyl deacetylase